MAIIRVPVLWFRVSCRSLDACCVRFGNSTLNQLPSPPKNVLKLPVLKSPAAVILEDLIVVDSREFALDSVYRVAWGPSPHSWEDPKSGSQGLGSPRVWEVPVPGSGKSHEIRGSNGQRVGHRCLWLDEGAPLPEII